MCDARDLLYDAFELDDSRPVTPRPSTPTPDHPRTLCRTISHASLDTVLPPKKRGIRRPIEEIAKSLKYKSAKKKKHSSAQEPKKEKAANGEKAAKRARKAASPLRASSQSQRSEEESVLAIADGLHNGAPFKLDPPLTFSGYKSDSLIDIPLFKEDDEDCVRSIRKLVPGEHIAAKHKDEQLPLPTPKASISDVQLDIRAAETDVTIWDGLQVTHHVYKCRLLLRCSAHPFDTVSLPDIRHVEMECKTRPAGSPYARPPVLQASYEGATHNSATNPDEPPKVKPAEGIHMDRVWCKIRNDDGTWGWYRDAFVPLSSRLFDKMEYREFKVVSKVWVEESSVESELTFGISMLLRGLDMSE